MTPFRPLVLTWIALLLLLAAGLATGCPDLVLYPLFPALVLHLAVGRGAVARGFAWRPALFLGEISYALYLLHIFLLHPLDVTRALARRVLLPVPADAVAVLAAFAVLIAAAAACHRWVEQPARDAIRRLARTRRPARAPV
jgi:peptidoglycan/LPS O-acetylase OafA/YrhL